MQTQRNGFIVLLVLGAGSYQPIFTEDDYLMFFDSKEEAEAEIKDCVQGTEQAVKDGDMEEPYTYDDYTSVPATIINPDAEPKQQKIVCFFDGDQYEMLRSEDDWKKVNGVDLGNDKIAIVWGVVDVLQRAEERDIKLTDEEAKEILDEVYDNHDASIGICWDTLDIFTNDYLAEHKKSKRHEV